MTSRTTNLRNLQAPPGSDGIQGRKSGLCLRNFWDMQKNFIWNFKRRRKWNARFREKFLRPRDRSWINGDWPTLGARGFIHSVSQSNGKWWTEKWVDVANPLIVFQPKRKKAWREFHPNCLFQFDVSCAAVRWCTCHFSCPAVFSGFLVYSFVWIFSDVGFLDNR